MRIHAHHCSVGVWIRFQIEIEFQGKAGITSCDIPPLRTNWTAGLWKVPERQRGKHGTWKLASGRRDKWMNRLRRNVVSLTLPAISPCSWQGKAADSTACECHQRHGWKYTVLPAELMSWHASNTRRVSVLRALNSPFHMCFFFFSCILSKYCNFTWDENVVEFVNWTEHGTFFFVMYVI